ncbi:TetR/AcrR family transcriptional regulator [Rhodococcus sp. RS1C4]|nr:TetR/AcrR family transcriptional regulator [Rhodococcus sp. RS1C4]
MAARGPGRPRNSARTRNGADTRSEILDAAAEFITTLGYGATTTRRIADAVGVSQNVIYHHFDSKDDILGALLTALVQPALTTALALDETPIATDLDCVARLWALVFFDSSLMLTWQWNLGVLFALPETRAPAFASALRSRSELQDIYVRFADAVAARSDVPPIGDLAFRLVESTASIRSDDQAGPETATNLARSCVYMAGWIRDLPDVAVRAAELLEAVDARTQIDSAKTP